MECLELAVLRYINLQNSSPYLILLIEKSRRTGTPGDSDEMYRVLPGNQTL